MRIVSLLARLLRRSFPVRALKTITLLSQGVTASPYALIAGNGIRIGRGSSIGSGTTIESTEGGTIVLGDNVWISKDVGIETDTRIHVGTGTTIQRRATVLGTVTLGSECILAPNVFISSGTHPFRAAPELSIREQERRISRGELDFNGLDRPIVIGDDCWLGTNVVVCPGVTIGSSSVIGANSVVTKDVPPRSVYAGSPARKIGER